MSESERNCVSVESRLPKPEQSLIDSAVDCIKQNLQGLEPTPGGQVVGKATHLIARAVEAGHQRNAAEWSLLQMKEYGWIRLFIPSWGGVFDSGKLARRSSVPTSLRISKTAVPLQYYRNVVRTENCQRSERWFFGPQEYTVQVTDKFWNPRHCSNCKRVLDGYDYDRAWCHDCSSNEGKLLDLYVAIHASGDSPDRIKEWPTIRALLRDEFGMNCTNEQLWEYMRDRIEVNLGWDNQTILKTKYADIVQRLKSGELSKLVASNGIAINNSPKQPGAIVENNFIPKNAGTEQINTGTLDSMKPSHRMAYLSFQHAAMKLERTPEGLTDNEAWEYLKGNGIENAGELDNYQLPMKDTYTDYLTKARRLLGESKKSPRANASRSVVKRSEI